MGFALLFCGGDDQMFFSKACAKHELGLTPKQTLVHAGKSLVRSAPDSSPLNPYCLHLDEKYQVF